MCSKRIIENIKMLSTLNLRYSIAVYWAELIFCVVHCYYYVVIVCRTIDFINFWHVSKCKLVVYLYISHITHMRAIKWNILSVIGLYDVCSVWYVRCMSQRLVLCIHERIANYFRFLSDFTCYLSVYTWNCYPIIDSMQSLLSHQTENMICNKEHQTQINWFFERLLQSFLFLIRCKSWGSLKRKTIYRFIHKVYILQSKCWFVSTTKINWSKQIKTNNKIYLF